LHFVAIMQPQHVNVGPTCQWEFSSLLSRIWIHRRP